MRRLLVVFDVRLVVLLAGCTSVPAGDDLIEEDTGRDDPADGDDSAEADDEAHGGDETAPSVDGELEVHHIDALLW